MSSQNGPVPSRRLHIGCGHDYREGFVNLDRGRCRVDVHHDLEVVPYPFPEDGFELVLANQVLEHLDLRRWPEIVAELWRVSAPNAVWEFRSPHAASDNYATDPTHRMPFTTRTFDYFDATRPLGALGRIYGFEASLRVLTAKRIYADRYGDDVYHRLLVVKPGTAPRVPADLPQHLYRAEPRLVSQARDVAARSAFGRQALAVAQLARRSLMPSRRPAHDARGDG
jgi:hypothetical protein